MTAMTYDATYFDSPELAAARRLQRAGQWDTALALLPDGHTATALRADILVDRHMWRLDPVDDALAAIDAVRGAQPKLAVFLTAQLEYWRRLFGGVGPALGGDPVEEFASVVDHAPLAGWAAFWRAVTLENLHKDPVGAAEGYAHAHPLAQAGSDLLLESYVVRHQGAQLCEKGEKERGVALLRRSLHLRAACGARPHVAAAQATLAGSLGSVPEAEELRAIAASVAHELDLTWLKPQV
ncbi:hypothetical protein [Kitasatospora atroaurantiaca]